MRARIGFLPEDRKQHGLRIGLSVDRGTYALSHLNALARLGIVGRARERREAEGIVNLRIRTAGPEQQVLHLSGGNQQKVVLAKWLAPQAAMLILDEPTRGVDVGARREIYAADGPAGRQRCRDADDLQSTWKRCWA